MERFANQDGGCCGVYALSVCLGVPFDTLMEAMRLKFNKRMSWKGATTLPERLATLKAFGAEYTELTELKGLSVIQAAWPGRLDTSLPVMVHITGHVLTLYDGLVIDQCAACQAPDHRSRNYTIQSAYKMLTEPYTPHTEDLI